MIFHLSKPFIPTHVFNKESELVVKREDQIYAPEVPRI
uniref:Uncharacterized protein n=1 Tax=Arundo donax TaxID=35708 RepID=A0A0A8YX22_ARUDO